MSCGGFDGDGGAPYCMKRALMISGGNTRGEDEMETKKNKNKTAKRSGREQR